MKLRALESIRYNDGKGTVESIIHRIFNPNGTLLDTVQYKYTYGDPAKGEIPDTLYKYEIDTTIDYTFAYDDLARLTSKTLSTSNINKTESYTYKTSKQNSTWTTPLVQSMTDFAGVQHVYTYDESGNITSDSYGGYTVSYAYDSLNRLTRYNDPVYGWTCVYVYDNRGNITEMQEYEYTTAEALGEPLYTYEYEYGNSTWADLLTSCYGTDIAYDELGNPRNWINGESLTWQYGRQLASYDGSVNYTYNADGLRTGKSGDRTTEYYIVNGTYLGEVTTIGSAQYRIIYLYDETGSVCGIEVTKIDDDTITTATYYFAKNLQGDVTAILDAQGNVVANYRYDAYGSIISVTDANGNYISSATHIANLNPFRYRGYMYDEESGFYYLSSRYYDPYIGRFLNADNVISGTSDSVNGYNPFVYCFNNPVNMDDASGNWPKWIKKVANTIAKAVKPIVKTVAKAAKPIVKTIQNVSSKISGTYSKGTNYNISTGLFVGGLQVSPVIDTKGTHSAQVTLSGGLTSSLTPSASVTSCDSITNAANTKKLEGFGWNVGASYCQFIEYVPVTGGFDIDFIPDTKAGKTYNGVTTNAGLGGSPGFEAHINWSYTFSIEPIEFNIYDIAEYCYIKIMEW